MIEESAQVVATEGDFAWVETQRQSTCGACAANHACGTAVLSKVLGQRHTRVRALNPEGARVGDRVVVGLDEAALLRGSMAVYAVPLLTLLAGSIVGSLLAKQWLLAGEAMSVGLGIAGLVAGLVWLKGFTRRIRSDNRYQPVVLRRLPG